MNGIACVQMKNQDVLPNMPRIEIMKKYHPGENELDSHYFYSMKQCKSLQGVFMSKTKRYLIQLFLAIGGAFVALIGLLMFNQYVLTSISLLPRMILMIVTHWLIFLVPGILMIEGKETFGDIGFRKEKITRQIGIGILLACAMSLVLTILPIALGFKNMLSDEHYSQVWLFVFEFIYTTCGVALAEELVFRGYIFHKLLDIKNSRWLAIILSSVLFGAFHFFDGGVIQVVVTAVIGVILCMFREKIKGCTLLSLIVAHGFYDAMIVLWVSIL